MEKIGILDESTVFCAPKSVYKLKQSLNFKNAYSKFDPKLMKKFNFFTSRFNAGMDIELNYKPDLIMLSDVNLVEHTVLDPFSDMIQIVGRFRNGLNYITHITNFLRITLTEVKKTYYVKWTSTKPITRTFAENWAMQMTMVANAHSVPY